MAHDLSGICLSCAKIFNRYPNFYQPLRDWFTALQLKHPEAHLSCAGRGAVDQEAAVARGASRAHWGQSSHNFNAAIDIFRLLNGQYDLDRAWFDATIAPNLNPQLNWYGAPDAKFYERPHVEARDWEDLVKNSILKLVE